jgi:two-component system sensor histidine kinase KdpD
VLRGHQPGGKENSPLTDHRPNPDALLSALKNEEARQNRAKLKVFLGMSPGVGKTYAMLEAARRELAAGTDIVIGYVETHGRKETDALTEGLPTIPRKALEHRGVHLTEMDLDAILARRPRLVMVDELAHNNAPGSRHPKRWQDVKELLESGIDVFTTINVQHLDSRADLVRQITGAEIRETVPDSLLDSAELELVDLPPAELRERLQEGKVYVPDRATAAAANFFRESNLTALREIALRLVADHVGEDTQQFHRAQSGAGSWKTGHRLLVAVSPSPFSEPLIRWTRRIADSLKCPWVAVYVENSKPLPESVQARLEKNLALARSLNAEVIATADEDLVSGLLRTANEHNVSLIIVGKPVTDGLLEWYRAGRFLRRLARASGNIDVQIVRAEKIEGVRTKPGWRLAIESGWKQYAAAAAAIAAVALACAFLNPLTGPRIPGMVFLLAVVVLALFLGRGPVFFAGTASALVWDYFFLPPRFTFVISSAEDAVLFGAYFVTSLVLGQLVSRTRTQEQAERRREHRALALYHLMREFAQAGTRDEVVWQLMAEVTRVLNAQAAVVLPIGSGLAAHPDSSLDLTDKELQVAQWAYHHRQSAGRFTDNLPGAEATHLPLTAEKAVLGVLVVKLPVQTLTLAHRDLLDAYARQSALVLDRVALRASAEQSKLTAESERLSNALLNSISHELRTPLEAITNANRKLANARLGPVELRDALTGEIQEAAARLDRLVGNLLDVTRLESDHVRAKLDWIDLGDLIHTTVRGLNRELAGRQLHLPSTETHPLVRLDFTLTQQALSNLLLNAATHTPPGTNVGIEVSHDNDAVEISVTDNGPGLPPEYLPKVFDKFFRAPASAPGGSGLGLAIVRGFVEAQGGQVLAANRPEGGAVFTIRLPQTEKPPPLRA